MYKWNDEKIKKTFDREKRYAKEKFTEEELEHLYLDKLSKQTKSKRIYRMISLAYTLGKLKGIQTVDEGKTPVTLR
ncbi:MAG: hypothetical protein ACRCW0_00250 [Clostridium sp.]